MPKKRKRSVWQAGGTAIIWPRGLEVRYGITGATRRIWEKKGLLPKRDCFVGGKPAGWRPETLVRAERGELRMTCSPATG
jgi:hypothetical protein